MKWMRSYRLQVEGDGETLIITNPITIRFTVSRRTGSTLNVMQADIYNLDENTRNFLFQEEWVLRDKKVTFEGGYDTLSTLFKGTLWSGHSYREGSDIITSIECKSEIWELDNTTIYETLNADISVRDVLTNLAGRFKNLSIGAIGEYPEKLLRPTVANGNVWNMFRKYSGNTAFIDNGKIYALRRNEVVDGEIVTIDAATGLLATPRRSDVANIQVQMLFEPRLVMGQWAELGAGVNKIYNGRYKIFGIQHTGTISESVGGDLRTIADLYTGGQVFKVVKSG